MSVLKAEGIVFAYPGAAPVLDGVDVAVSSGERLCLHAPSGFGKTTLARVLAGYAVPQQGSVTLDDAPLPRRGASPVQMIGQHPEHMLDPRLRIRDSLAEAGSIDPMLLERLGIARAWLARYPRELSGGEMQRCCIARALRAEPRFIVADEISTMLDAITQVQIWEALLGYCADAGCGLIFTSHSEALVERLATRVMDLTRA